MQRFHYFAASKLQTKHFWSERWVGFKHVKILSYTKFHALFKICSQFFILGANSLHYRAPKTPGASTSPLQLTQIQSRGRHHLAWTYSCIVWHSLWQRQGLPYSDLQVVYSFFVLLRCSARVVPALFAYVHRKTAQGTKQSVTSVSWLSQNVIHQPPPCRGRGTSGSWSLAPSLVTVPRTNAST